MKTLVLCSALLVLAGCATRKDAPLTTEQINQPILKMDMQQVQNALGQPFRQTRNNGLETWIYRQENSSGMAQLKGNCELQIGFSQNDVTSVTLNESGTTPLAQPLDACRPFYDRLRQY